ncbi:hypothetical protein [Acidovorax sp. PRC11]|uniref:hypothetical protein n=1 Tax=Acidovorax sp. PRC11 TaxID=2962592 RepID=UPI0028822CD5|nr:hypothetical protein [Acidovorax sp. PRC11]MDT0137271.1 hypothetical protein [Acidovorax sp. PRC11]
MTPEKQIDSAELFSHVMNCLNSISFKYQSDPANKSFRLAFASEVFTYEAIIICGNQFLTVNSRLPLTVQEHHVDEVLKLINGRNIRTPIGNYEFNEEFHFVNSRNGMYIDELPRAAVVKNLIERAVGNADLISKELSKILLN